MIFAGDIIFIARFDRINLKINDERLPEDVNYR